MNPGRFFWLPAAAALVLMCVNCSGDRTQDPPRPATASAPRASSTIATSPCALIRKAQVEEIFAEAFLEGEDRSRELHPLGQRICFWKAAKPDSYRFLQVSIIRTSAMPNGKSPSAAAIFQQTRETLVPTSDVAGVADEAFWGTMGLHLLQGDAYVNIAVGNSDRPGNLQIAKKAAAIIVPGL